MTHKPAKNREQTIFTSLLIILVGICIYLSIYLPPPGWAVTIIAIGAAIMSAQVDLGRWKKFSWLLVLALFVQVEFRAIARDRKEQESHFSKTLDTITGGESFAFLTMKPLGERGYPFIVEMGNNPLRNVHIQVLRLQFDQEAPTPISCNFQPMDLAVNQRSYLQECPVDLTGRQSAAYRIYFDALQWALVRGYTIAKGERQLG